MPSHRSIRHRILFTLLALALVACDPASLPFQTVLQVQSAGDAVYAYAVRRLGGGLACCPYGDPTFYVSQDGGQTWTEIETPPPELERKLQEAAARSIRDCGREIYGTCARIDGLGRLEDPVSAERAWSEVEGASYPYSDEERELAYKSLDDRPVCSEAYPLECFRLGGQGQIERSMDGSASWSVDWQLAQDRGAWLRRRAARSRPRVPADLRPLDLTVLDTAEGTRAVAAMGNQGVMVRTPQGVWESWPVDQARPLPDGAD